MSPDLRPAVLSLIVLVPVVAGLDRPAALLVALAGALVLALVRGTDRRTMVRRLAHLEGFLIALLLLLPLTTPGRIVAGIGPLAVSAEGIALAAQIAARINAIALLVLALLDGAAADSLGRALHGLGAPPRFVWLFDLTLRHVGTARAAFLRQSEAMRARGFAPGTGLHAWRSYGHLAGGGLVRALARAARMDEAMRLRGGGRPLHRPLPPMTGAGRRAVAGAAVAACLLLWLEHRG